MNKNDIKNKLMKILKDSFNMSANISIEGLNFVDDLGMDSVSFISLIIEIETSFRIIIPEELLIMDYFCSFNDCYNNLCKIICPANEEQEGS